MNLSSHVTLVCDSQYTLSSISYASGKLEIVADYTTDMEGKDCVLSLTFDLNIINSQNISLSFVAVSETSPLIISKNMQYYNSVANVVEITCFIVFGIFILSLSHKMIGAELLVCCQTVYLSKSLYSQIPIIISPIKRLQMTTGFWIFQSDSYRPLKTPFTKRVDFSPYFA